MFADAGSNEIKQFKAALNEAFYKGKVYDDYPAYAIAGDALQSQGATKRSGAISVFYAMWFLKPTKNRLCENSANNGVETKPDIDKRATKGDEKTDYRLKWPANYRCKDGHYARSKNEMLVDNWLCSYGVVYAYEKAVYSAEDDYGYYCDFFLQGYGLYIEIWGPH